MSLHRIKELSVPSHNYVLEQALIIWLFYNSHSHSISNPVSLEEVESEELTQVGGEWEVSWSINLLFPLAFHRNSDVF